MDERSDCCQLNGMVQSLRSWFCNGLVVNSRMDELFLGMDQWEMKNGK